MTSYYKDVPKTDWVLVTNTLLKKHPLKSTEITEIVLRSWDDIFKSKIGPFSIGKDIQPTPQIMSFLLHELIAHYLSKKHPDAFKIGTEKNEKDIQHISNDTLSVEIKGSSHPSQIFGNRSYAQPNSGKGCKDKNGYYITINFEKFSKKQKKPKILVIRFGYLEHSDWIAQKSATGQQARLGLEAYKYKLKSIYP